MFKAKSNFIITEIHHTNKRHKKISRTRKSRQRFPRYGFSFVYFTYCLIDPVTARNPDCIQHNHIDHPAASVSFLPVPTENKPRLPGRAFPAPSFPAWHVVRIHCISDITFAFQPHCLNPLILAHLRTSPKCATSPSYPPRHITVRKRSAQPVCRI